MDSFFVCLPPATYHIGDTVAEEAPHKDLIEAGQHVRTEAHHLHRVALGKHQLERGQTDDEHAAHKLGHNVWFVQAL